MSRFLLGTLTAVLLFATLNLRALAFAVESAGLPPQNTITMNFQNVDIPVLAKFISEITGRNFIIDESVRGKVTIISPSKVTPEQAYSIFQSVLQVKGFTTVQQGKIIKIEPARNVRSNAPLTTSQTPAESSGDESGLRSLCALVVVEIALRSDRYQYRTWMHASNHLAQRRSALRTDYCERFGWRVANQVVDADRRSHFHRDWRVALLCGGECEPAPSRETLGAGSAHQSASAD